MQKHFILGNIGRDAEVKNINGNDYIAFTCAESEGKDKPTTWYNVLQRSNRGENFARLLQKGAVVFVEGRLSVKTYTARDNSTKVDYTLFADDIKIARFADADNPAPAVTTAVPPLAAPQTKAPATTQIDVNAGDPDEDLPF